MTNKPHLVQLGILLEAAALSKLVDKFLRCKWINTYYVCNQTKHRVELTDTHD